MGWELETVEKPFVTQLVGMDWQHIAGDINDPAITQRANFTQVIQESVLRTKLAALNTHE
jgi:type I restriction enzyme R subunit